MFSKIFIERPRFAMVISIVLTIAGFICAFALPIALYPEITPPEIVVQAVFPGASADVVTKTVGMPIEDEINGVDDMLYMTSESSDTGRYRLTVTFKVGTDPDMDQVKVQNRLQQATAKLPVEVTQQGLTVKKQSSNTLGFLTIYSPDNSKNILELSDYTQNVVKNNLSRVDGVGEVNIYSSKLSMRVWLDADKITALNLPIAAITTAIAGQNYQPSIGAVGKEPANGGSVLVYTLQTKGRLNEIENFEKIIVRTEEDGGLVYLKDVARIEIGEESYFAIAEYNSVPSVAVEVNLLSGANAINAMDNLKAELKRMQKFFPQGIEYSINYDSTQYIRASIEEVVMTLILTFVLVVAVCYLFLQNWRATLVPSVAIPVSLLSTFIVMAAFGFSINMFTLFGLVLAIGLVVDDAIVVVERVLTLMDEEHLSAKEASIKAMQQVSSAIVATTLVLLAIFVPIGFISGITGKIYLQFAVAISTAVVFSAINALTLSPALCSILLQHIDPVQKGFLHWFNIKLARTRDKYVATTAFFARKISVIALFFGLLVLGVGALLQISQTSFVPPEDQGVIFMNVQLPEGSSRQRTYDLMVKASKVVREEPAIVGMTNVIGASMIAGTGENVGLSFIMLKPWGERGAEDYSTNILNRLRAKLSQFPEAQIQLFEPPAIMGLGMVGGLDYRLQSTEVDDPQDLELALQKLLYMANTNPNISYAYTTFTAQTPNIFIEIDREKAEMLQVPLANIYAVLQNYLGSRYINDINLGTQINKVVIQADLPFRKDFESIKELYVHSNNDTMVPLGSLLKMTKVLSPRSTYRYNQYPSATVNAVQNSAVSTGEAMKAMEDISTKLPKGYTFQWSGMSYQEAQNQGQITYLIVLAVVFGYLFLVAQYESWWTPLPVLLSVAVASLGALLGLFITGLPLSIYAQLGLILLVGLASKNAILIVEFAKEAEVQDKLSTVKAALVGTKERFRAVLMTAFTFILGVLPMIVATGAGAASRRALGVPVFYGMLLGTAAGLVVIPLLYILIRKIEDKLTGKGK